MPTREELIAQVEAKRRREDLIRRVEEKRQREVAGVEQEPSLGRKALDAVVKGAKVIDSYTGAPVRSAISTLQDDFTDVGGAAKAFKENFGDEPDKAPTALDIAKKAGLSDKRGVLKTAAEQRKFDEMFNPGLALSYKQTGKKYDDVETFSPAEMAAVGIDFSADWTNLIPVGLVGKSVAKTFGKTALGTAERSAKITTNALKKSEGAAGKLGKKIISSHLGPSEESIDYYLKNHDRLKDIPKASSQVEALKGNIDQAAAPMGEAIISSEKELADTVQAQKDKIIELGQQLSREESRLNALKTEKTTQAKEARLMAMDKHRENIRMLSEALKDQKLRLDEAQKLAAREVAPGVNQAVQRLGDEVSKGSAKSFKILEESGVAVPKKQFTNDLNTVIEALDSEAATDKAVALVDSLKNFRDRLRKFPDQIPGSTAKRLIQQLDDEVKYLEGGEKLRGKDGMIQGMRRYLDRQLKVVPEYRKQMVPVAMDTRLLKKAGNLRDEQHAINLLGRLGKNSSKVEEDTIRAIEARFGYDFRSKLDPRNMPEHRRLIELEQKLKSAKHGEEAKRISAQIKEIEDRLSVDPDLMAGQRRISELESSVQSAKDPAIVMEKRSKLEAAKQEAAPFDKILPDKHGRTRTQNVINNQLRINRRTRDIETQKMLQSLDAKYGTNYGQQLEDLRHLSEFDKEFNRGSTNVNMWGIASGAVGTMLFGPLGATLGGIGVLVGKGMDKFGPEVARVILDQAPMLQKMRPSQWVQGLEIPEAAKKQLVENLSSVGQMAGQSTRGSAAASKAIRPQELRRVAESEENQDRSPAKGPDAWAKRGADNLGLAPGLRQTLMQSKEGKRLLIEASDLPPGSRGLQRIKEQITQKGLGK